MLYFLFLFIAGLIGGFLGGLLGIGGGIIYIVVLPVALNGLGVPREELVQYTIANSIFASFFSALSANYFFIRRNTFYLKEVLLLGFVGTIISLLLLRFVVNTTWYSKDTFNLVIILMLLYMLLKTLLNAHNGVVNEPQKAGTNLKLSFAGLVSGAVSALSGLGGGVVIIPILTSLFRMEIKKANAISLGVIGITSFCMTVFNLLEQPKQEYHYYNAGYVIFPVALALAAGVVLASPMGVRASRMAKPQLLYYLFSFFLALVIIRKIVELAAYPG